MLGWFLSVDWRVIPLTQSKWAYVDLDSYPELAKHRWHASEVTSGGAFYARRATRKSSPGGREMIFMHRQVSGPAANEVVDHINHNTLDNRRKNLRNVSQRANLQHVNPSKKTSRYRWVSQEKRLKTWRVCVHPQGGKRPACRMAGFRNEHAAAFAANCAMSHFFPNDTLNQIPADKTPADADKIALKAFAACGQWEDAYLL